MTKFLYLRLATNNLRKNRQTYTPFLLAAVMLTFTLYSFADITMNPGLREVPGYTAFLMMLSFGMVVVSLFAAIFLFYANSFLIKRRKKEMGLYSILGMEKKHISRVLRHELALCYLITMALGLGLGILLSRLLLLVLRMMLQVTIPLVITLSPFALAVTPIVFAALFLLLMIYNSWQVRFASPIELLRGGQVGEKEPRSRWFFALVSVALLAAGYFIALSVSNALSAIMWFFVAVVLVILGTYCLFMAGSLSILKLLKNNKRIFYKPQNFVTLSGMLYRMKQNAAGLASIAILCTMAMVTIGTTAALYLGAEASVDALYPSDLKLNVSSAEDLERAEAALKAASQATGVPLTTLKAFESYVDALTLAEGELRHIGDISSESLLSFGEQGKILEICVVTADTFRRLNETPLSLSDDQLAWYSSDVTLPDSLIWEGNAFTTLLLDRPSFLPSFTSSASLGTVYLVLNNEHAIRRQLLTLGQDSGYSARTVFTLQADMNATDGEKDALVAAFRERSTDFHSLFQKHRMRAEMYALYSGFLFVGVFLGIIFLMATALIIYFKQISEGYQDQDRFMILQKVGMSAGGVRHTVNVQILTVFFLPLIVALFHVTGSLKMITLMLRMFGLVNIPYITLNVYLAAAFIAALYSAFYAKTAKTYYRLVRF